MQLSQPPAQIHMLLQPSSLCYGFSKRADKSACKTQWRVSQRGWLQMWLSSALLNKTSSCCFEQCVVTTTRHLVKKRKPRTIHSDFKTSPFSSPTDFSRQVQIICQWVLEKAVALVWPVFICCPKSTEGISGKGTSGGARKLHWPVVKLRLTSLRTGPWWWLFHTTPLRLCFLG